MIVFILVAIVAVFFIAGISLVFKGYLNMPDLDNSDIIELEKGLDTVKTEGEKLNMELASTQKELCETRINLQEAKKLEDDVASLQDKEKRYVADISKLKKEFDEILSKADVQAKNAVEVINSLNSSAILASLAAFSSNNAAWDKSFSFSCSRVLIISTAFCACSSALFNISFISDSVFSVTSSTLCSILAVSSNLLLVSDNSWMVVSSSFFAFSSDSLD